MAGDPGRKESFELMEGGTGGRAQAMDLNPEGRRPKGKVGCHIDSSYTVLLTNLLPFSGESQKDPAHSISADLPPTPAPLSQRRVDCPGQSN